MKSTNLTHIRATCWLAIAAISLAAVGAGCARHASSGSSSTNVLHVAMLSSPATFDPAMLEDITTMDLLQQIFEGLVQWNTHNKLAPALAQSWDVSKDGRTYTFHLRKDAVFQDGKPVTAQDVYYSFRRALDPALKSPVAMTYMGDIVGSDAVSNGTSNDLTGVKVLGPFTVAITIKQPKAYWISTLTYSTDFIVSKAEAGAVAAPLTYTEVAAGAGTGPFKLASYLPDQKAELVANQRYWDGPPRVAGQEWLIEKDAGTRHALYVSGQLDDVDEDPGDIEADSADPVLKDQLHWFPRAQTYYVALDQNVFAPFKDIRVRQALAYATDKSKLVQTVFDGKMNVAEGILPVGIPSYDPGLRGIPYDPAKAKALLAAAGYPGGKGLPPIQIYYRESQPATEKMVDMLRQMWEDNLGITVQGERTEWSVLLQQRNNNTLPCVTLRWAADYLDAQDFYWVLFDSHSPDNHFGYTNPTFDSLCETANTDMSEASRKSLYRQAGKILTNDVPVIPIYYQQDPELVKPYVSGLDDCLLWHLPYKHVKLSAH